MKHKKIYIWISIIVIIGLLVVFTFAWVRGQQYSEINDSNVAVSVGNNIEVSLTGVADSFGESVNLDFNQVTLAYIAGDGYDFYKPNSIPPVYNDATGWSSVNASEYIKFDLYFRAPTDVDLYLSKKSYILPSTNKRQIGNDPTVINETDIVNKSSYGPFTRDYIAGASRLAILSENEQIQSEIEREKYTFTKLWVPNTNYYLYDTGGFNYQFNENSSNIDAPPFYTVIKDGDNIFRSGTYNSNLVATTINAYRNKNNGDTPFASIIGTNDTNLVTKHVVVKVWIDGTDREALDPLTGGNIKINLQFLGIKRS